MSSLNRTTKTWLVGSSMLPVPGRKVGSGALVSAGRYGVHARLSSVSSNSSRALTIWIFAGSLNGIRVMLVTVATAGGIL